MEETMRYFKSIKLTHIISSFPATKFLVYLLQTFLVLNREFPLNDRNNSTKLQIAGSNDRNELEDKVQFPPPVTPILWIKILDSLPAGGCPSNHSCYAWKCHPSIHWSNPFSSLRLYYYRMVGSKFGNKPA